MSFILDALRKSEHERRRGLLPGVAHIPYALPRAQLPVWVPVAIAALAVALVMTGFAWWYTTRPGGHAAARLAASAVAPPSAVAPSWSTPPQPAAEHRAEVQAPGGTRLDAPAPEAPAQRAAAPLPSSQPASPPAPAAVSAALPNASALAASGVAPPLQLQLIVYDADPAKRFVRINGRRYSEGHFLTEGPQLLRIDERSVVLRQQGREFVLLPE